MAVESGTRSRWFYALTGTTAVAVLAFLQVLTGFIGILISLVAPGGKVDLQQQDVGLRHDSVKEVGAEISEAIKRSLATANARPNQGGYASYRTRSRGEPGVYERSARPRPKRTFSTRDTTFREVPGVAINSGEVPPAEPRRTLDEIPSEHD